MAIVFKVPPPIRFQRVEGQQSKTQTVSFPRPVHDAQVAVQAFSLDFEGIVERPVDKLQISTRQLTPPGTGGNDVEIEVAVNYSGKPSSETEYNATVTVLVIADV